MWREVKYARGRVENPMIDKFDNSNTLGVKLHLQEAEIMKKEWYGYALSAIEKLHDKVEANAIQLQKEREEFFRSLVDLRDKLTEELKRSDTEKSIELKKVEEKLDAFISDMVGRFTSVNDCVEDTIEEHLDGDKVVFKQMQDDIQKVKDSQLVVTAKVKIYIVLTGVIITTVMSSFAGGALLLFKDAIKTWIGS